jgi:hypothetical protein
MKGQDSIGHLENEIHFQESSRRRSAIPFAPRASLPSAVNGNSGARLVEASDSSSLLLPVVCPAAIDFPATVS